MRNIAIQLEGIIKKHNDIEKKLSNHDVLETSKLIELNKEYSELAPIVEVINLYNENKKNLISLKDLLKDEDNSIREMAEEEIKEKNEQLKNIEADLLKSLIPKDINDEKNSILEIRAGTGGDEASLFASDLLNMYQRYSDLNSWKFEILTISLILKLFP